MEQRNRKDYQSSIKVQKMIFDYFLGIHHKVDHKAKI